MTATGLTFDLALTRMTLQRVIPFYFQKRTPSRYGEANLANQRPGNRPPKMMVDMWRLPCPMPQTCT